jgi:YD repeat-containing protein
MSAVSRLRSPTAFTTTNISIRLQWSLLPGHPPRLAHLLDPNSGLIIRATDVNNSVTANYMYDNLGRQISLTQNGTQGGTTLARTTSTVYDDVGLSVTTMADQISLGDQQLSSTTYYDPVGRVRLVTDTAGNKTQKAYRVGTSNGCVAPTLAANSNGMPTSTTILSCELESNPYSALDSSMGWTLTLRTAVNPTAGLPTAGLVTVQKTTFGGAAPPAPWGTNTNVTGNVFITANDQSAASCWSFSNFAPPTTDVTDQFPHTTRYCHDGLGRLVGVTDAAANITQHTYDLLDNVTQVTQSGVLARIFSYSQGRLAQACNPETSGSSGSSGCATYSYDSATGNLVSRTDAGGRATCFGSLSYSSGGWTCNSPFTYDGLNRPNAKYYSDGTPTVSYTYDQSGWTGALSSVALSSGGGTYGTSYSYDALGRINASSQTAAGNSYAFPFAYGYTLADQLIKIQYPGSQGQLGEAVDYVPDSGGRITTVKNGASGGPVYASPIAYTPAGGVATLPLGNGVTEQASWNDRLQLTQLNVAPPQLNAANAPASLLTLGLFPCTSQTTSCPLGNVGNILTQAITLPGLNASQTYQYDALNHLSSVAETIGSQNWSQTYNHVGGRENRYVTAVTGPPGFTLSAITPTAPSDYNSNNQMQDSAVGSPDAAGELKSIGPYTLAYDAEGRVTSSTFNVTSNGNLVPTQLTTYVYDGEGQRVMKLVCPTASSCTAATAGSVQTVYVYDAAGNLSQEYSTNPSTPPCAICYVTADQVGSTRLVTDGNGNPVSRYDYLPFGEEIPAEGKGVSLDGEGCF